MKKFLVFLCAALLLVGAVACKKQEAESTDTVTTDTVATDTAMVQTETTQTTTISADTDTSATTSTMSGTDTSGTSVTRPSGLVFFDRNTPWPVTVTRASRTGWPSISTSNGNCPASPMRPGCL